MSEKIKFTDLERPVIVSSLRSNELDYIIQDIKESEENGAKAFLLHIEMLDEKYKNSDCFKKIFSTTKYPIMALNYRGGAKVYSDEELADVLLEAVSNGAMAVDVFADMFDNDSINSLELTDKIFKNAVPKDITMRAECVKKQKELINKIHSMGAEVLMSAHVNVELNCEQAISLALEIQSRGADIVKIITSCNSYNQALEILHTAAELKKHLKVPYLYQCNGPFGKFTRQVAPLFGSMLVLCHQKYSELSNREKPLISDVKEFYRVMKWRIED